VSQEPEAICAGIVVLSSTLQVLHMNRRALVLLNQLQHTGQSAGVERALTAPLRQHCHDIIETLQARLGSNNWERFQQNRMIGGSTNTILLKGVGLPDQRGLSYSRIVLLLSPHNQTSMPEISRRDSLDEISESGTFGADPPRTIGM